MLNGDFGGRTIHYSSLGIAGGIFARSIMRWLLTSYPSRPAWVALAVLIASITQPHPSRAAAFNFDAPVTYSGYASPIDVAVADMNEDDKLDLVAISDFETSVIVMLGRGGGSFEPGIRTTYFRAGFSLAVGDVDLDGHLDVIVASPSSGVFTLLRGDGTGNLALVASPYLGYAPCGVAIGDVNQDGWPDFIVADNGHAFFGWRLSLFLGAGGGAFTPEIPLPALSHPIGIQLVDVNQDGALDIVTGSTDGGLISVQIGDGKGGFGPVVWWLVGSLVGAVAPGDVDGDGNVDVAVMTVTLRGVILMGNGDGTFDPPLRLDPGRSDDGALVDLDEDGDLDLVTADRDTSEVSVMLGNGDGTFASQILFPAGADGRAIAVGDFNADGHVDAVVANHNPGTFSVLMGRGSSVSVGDEASPTLSLGAPNPNPARTELRVAFVLASAAPATLDLIDLSGRRVAARELGSLGPGQHQVTWAAGERVRAGVYWLRLQQGDETRVVRAVFLR